MIHTDRVLTATQLDNLLRVYENLAADTVVTQALTEAAHARCTGDLAYATHCVVIAAHAAGVIPDARLAAQRDPYAA